MRALPRLLALALFLTTPPLAVGADDYTPPPELAGLDAYVQQSMQAWHVPGLAIAVVKDDRIVWARGFGQRTLGKADRVDADTLFAVGSNTKAFTAASLGTLVDAGRLHWDDRVEDLLPDFRLSDPYLSHEVTLRDLLSHRSGVCGEDGVWYATGFSSQEVLRRLRFQKPHYSFRSQFCYSNSLYMTAGEVIPALTGQPWGDYVRAHFLAPLHMDSTVTSVTALKNHADVATPHAEVGGQVIPIEWANIDNVDPAGAIDSSVRDMAQWLRLVLADGKYDGRQLVSSAVLEQMQTPQMLIADGDAEGKFLKALNPGSSFYAYGLGFFLQDYAGTKVVWHSGHIDGMSAGLGMMPSRHVGVVVLSNMDQSWLPMALVWRVLDAYSGQPQHDWSGHILSYVKSLEDEDKKAQAKLEQAREPGGPSLPLKAYVGSYDNPLYGRVEITLEGGSLVMQLSRRFVGDMQHWNHQTFQVVWHYRYLDNSYARFDLDAFGVPQSLTLTGLATYTRVVEKPAGSAP